MAEDSRTSEAQPSQPQPAPEALGAVRPMRLRAVRYPNCYVWYVFLSALDLMFTWLVLHLEGQELNVVAAWIIHRWDLRGLVAFKFILVTMVICICEVVGRHNDRIGRILAVVAVGVTAVPVGLSLMELVNEFFR